MKQGLSLLRVACYAYCEGDATQNARCEIEIYGEEGSNKTAGYSDRGLAKCYV